METLPTWFQSVREWRVPRWGGWLYRWDAGNGKQQVGIDAWVGDGGRSLYHARLDAAKLLGDAMRELGMDPASLIALPVMGRTQ